MEQATKKDAELKGFYTIVYPKTANNPTETHRTLQIKVPKQGNFAGQALIGFMNGTDNTSDYQFFGFVKNNKIAFWKKFRETNTQEKLARIEAAFNKILTIGGELGKAYALNSGKCYRCNRLLTNPQSINDGIGPECIKK